MNRSRKSTSPRKSPANRSLRSRRSNQGGEPQGPTRRRSFNLHNASQRRRNSERSNVSIRRRRQSEGGVPIYDDDDYTSFDTSYGSEFTVGSGSRSSYYFNSEPSILRLNPAIRKQLGGLKQRSFNLHNASVRKNERLNESLRRRLRSGAPMGKHRSFNLHNASRKIHEKNFELQKNNVARHGFDMVLGAMHNYGRRVTDPNEYLHWSQILNETPPSIRSDTDGPISDERFLEIHLEVQQQMREAEAIRQMNENEARRQREGMRQLRENAARRRNWSRNSSDDGAGELNDARFDDDDYVTSFDISHGSRRKNNLSAPLENGWNRFVSHLRDPDYNDRRGQRTSSPILNTRDAHDARDNPEQELSPIEQEHPSRFNFDDSNSSFGSFRPDSLDDDDVFE